MAVYKDGDKWRVIYRYTNYKGERKQTQKRGFATKREAVAWEREVMLKSESKLDMTFASFFATDRVVPVQEKYATSVFPPDALPALTFTFTEAFFDPLFAVIVAVPSATAFTLPLALTVATVSSLLLQVMAQDASVTGIFICPPSRENLEQRLRRRGTESEESIRVRLGNVAKEVATAYRYHYVIIHQDWSVEPRALEIATEEVYAVIAARRLELENRRDFLDALTASLKA